MSSRGRGYVTYPLQSQSSTLTPVSKFKVSRGGGRHFSRDLDPRIAERNRLNNPQDASSEEDEDIESDEDDDIHSRSDPAPAALPTEMKGLNLKLGNTEPVQEEEMSRTDRKARKNSQAKKEAAEEDSEDEGDEDDDELLNPQKATEKRQAEKAKAKTAVVKPAIAEMSRKDKWVERRSSRQGS